LRFLTLILFAIFYSSCAHAHKRIPEAVIADPPSDTKFPARMEVLHIPSGGVEINGVVYVASGAGPHPTFLLFHGLPGNEKNLDLAQAVRRAGWNAVTVNYRGSWGSPGNFRFAQDLEDAAAVLSFIRVPENARRLSIDVNRIALGGHSLGGWVAAETLARDPNLLGGVLICPADFGAVGLRGQQKRSEVVALMNDNRESLAGVTGESMADELVSHAQEWSFSTLAPGLVHRQLFVLYSNDFLKPDSIRLVDDIKIAGGTTCTSDYVDTDHSWSDHRIALESLVINWLRSLPAHP
jgi:pimeloyl-ACP methyl ester carboxylesterase